MTKEEIIKLLDLDPRNLSQDPDGAYRYFGIISIPSIRNSAFRLPQQHLKQFPEPFSYCQGFSARECAFTSLINFPKHVNNLLIKDCKHITSLEHGPVDVTGNCSLGGLGISSLKYMPTLISSDFYCDFNENLKDPYEFRYALFSTIHGKITTGNKKISDILNKYKNNPSQNHIAIDKLLTLGESLGFTYD